MIRWCLNVRMAVGRCRSRCSEMARCRCQRSDVKKVDLLQLGLQRRQVLVYQMFLPILVVSSHSLKSILVAHLKVSHCQTPKAPTRFIFFVQNIVPSIPPHTSVVVPGGQEADRPIPVLVEIELLKTIEIFLHNQAHIVRALPSGYATACHGAFDLDR